MITVTGRSPLLFTTLQVSTLRVFVCAFMHSLAGSSKCICARAFVRACWLACNHSSVDCCREGKIYEDLKKSSFFVLPVPEEGSLPDYQVTSSHCERQHTLSHKIH